MLVPVGKTGTSSTQVLEGTLVGAHGSSSFCSEELTDQLRLPQVHTCRVTVHCV